MTPNEITTTIAVELKKTFDDPFKFMLIKRVDAWRSRLIKNSLDSTPSDRKFFRQTIYLPLTKEPEVLCDLGLELCDVAVTTKLPKVLRANSITFDYLGAINGANPFKETFPGMLAYKGKYSKKSIEYSNINDRVVIYNKPNLPMIRIDAIWDNPSEVSTLLCNGSQAENCDFWNVTYPCTNEILQMILEYVPKTFDRPIEEISTPVSPTTDKIV